MVSVLYEAEKIMRLRDKEEKIMTAKEWNTAIYYLEHGEFGDWVENDGRMVSIENMAGGRFLLMENNEVCGLVDEEWKAAHFLRTGKVL